MITTADTAKVLARAALFDQRFTKPNPSVTAAWTDAIAPTGLTLPALLDAVTSYYSTSRERCIGVGDVIQIAKNARQRAALAHNAATAVAQLPAGQGPKIGPAGGINADGKPAPGAYTVDNAIGIPCRTCGATPHTWCTNPDTGRHRKIPCPTRLTDAHHTKTPSAPI